MPVSAARVEVSRVVEAPPALVYRVIADYVDHHPRILPKPEFESLVVEKGGRGAGTLVRVAMKVMGARSESVLEVSEPEPGRVLLERDVAGTLETRFTVAPEGAGARVTLATEWAPRPGLRARIERWVQPRVARKLYERELALLAEYAPRVK